MSEFNEEEYNDRAIMHDRCMSMLASIKKACDAARGPKKHALFMALHKAKTHLHHAAHIAEKLRKESLK